MTSFDINTVFRAYTRLTRSQRRSLLFRLQASGIPVTRIEAYAYPEAPGIKHLFFHFSDRADAVPYYLLDASTLQQLQALLLSEAAHNVLPEDTAPSQ